MIHISYLRGKDLSIATTVTRKSKHQQCKKFIVRHLVCSHRPLGSNEHGQLLLSSSAIHRPHGLSWRLRPATFHSCFYPWWLFYSTGISNMLRFPKAVFSPMVFWPLFRDCKPATWWCQTLAFLLTPWILGFPMILRLDLHLWSLFFSHSSQKSHSFSPRPLQFFKTSATWKTLTCSWDLRPGFDGTLGPSRPVLLHAHPGEILLEDFISLMTPLSLISAISQI